MKQIYYIISTKLPSCLNTVYKEGRFDYLYQNQPDSGDFLKIALKLSKKDLSQIRLAFFDRVQESDNCKRITGIYSPEKLFLDQNAGLYKGRDEKYSLILKLLRKFDPALPFWDGTALWSRLEVTQGKGVTNFYNGSRMLLPISKSDFEMISRATSDPQVAQDIANSYKKNGTFSTENALRDYLSENLNLLEEDLEPIEADNYMEYDTGSVGRIDLLCKDRAGGIVIVELKKRSADDAVVGQLSRYMGWAKSVPEWGDKQVRGIIVANVISDHLKYAVKPLSHVKLLSYTVDFKIQHGQG